MHVKYDCAPSSVPRLRYTLPQASNSGFIFGKPRAPDENALFSLRHTREGGDCLGGRSGLHVVCVYVRLKLHMLSCGINKFVGVRLYKVCSVWCACDHAISRRERDGALERASDGEVGRRYI